MPPKKRSEMRGSHETERMSTRARSPEVEIVELGTRDSEEPAGSWGGGVGGGSRGPSRYVGYRTG